MTNAEQTNVNAATNPGGLPALGIGAWAWGDRLYWGYGRQYGEREVREAFDAAVASGINFFDTAEFYGFGESERLLGKFMAESRRSPVIATKFLPLPWRVVGHTLKPALLRSLQRLGLPSVDLYQIHFPLPLVSSAHWLDELADVCQEGLARSVGVSNYTLGQTLRAHSALQRRGVALTSNQVSFSLLDRRPEKSGLLHACRQLGISVIAYSPLASGALTGKYTNASAARGARGLRLRRNLAHLGPLVALLRELGQRHGGKTPAQVALNWTICKGTVPIPGAKNASQAEQNAGALGWRLEPDEVAALDAAADAWEEALGGPPFRLFG